MKVSYRECPGLSALMRHSFLFRARMSTGYGGEAVAWFVIFFRGGIGAAKRRQISVTLSNIGNMSGFPDEDRLDDCIARLTGEEPCKLHRIEAGRTPEWIRQIWPDAGALSYGAGELASA